MMSDSAKILATIAERLDRLEDKLDLMLNRLVEVHWDHEVRIRRLERDSRSSSSVS